MTDDRTAEAASENREPQPDSEGAVERSRERWKQQVDQQKRRLAELEAELQKTADATA